MNPPIKLNDIRSSIINISLLNKYPLFSDMNFKFVYEYTKLTHSVQLTQ